MGGDTVKPVIIGDATLYLGDCMDVLPTIKADCVVTDPPYPDYHTDTYKQTSIDFLADLQCRQYVFWSPRLDFPLDYTAIHIWDKITGAGCPYERIFERNGQAGYRLYRHSNISSELTANFAKDVFTGHPSQKPIELLVRLIPKESSVIFDPFMGSGATGVASLRQGRKFIGIEIDKKYFDIAAERIDREHAQGKLF